MIKRIKKFIEYNNMLHQGDKIVIGLSGGADSVCLLMVLNSLKEEYNLQLRAVHINHMIRGEEATRDEEYASELAIKLGIPMDIFRINIEAMAKDLRITTEEAGRQFRYECFNQVKIDNNYTKIAVAHNKNDVAETVIFNMVRGSGIKGMAGISPVRDNIIRPLLEVSRVEIEEYLNSSNIEFCVDSTNLTTDYDRNKIRHNILPYMNDLNSKSIDHIYNASQSAKEYYDFVHQVAKDLVYSNLKEFKSQDKSAFSINIATLQKANLVVQKEAVIIIVEKIVKTRKDISQKHILDIISLLSSGTGKSLNLPYNLLVSTDYDKLVFCINNNSNGINNSIFNIDINNGETIEIPWNDNNLSVRRFVCQNEDDRSQIFQGFTEDMVKKEYTKFVDYDKMLDKPCIRMAKDNDYVVINKEGNKKKLSRLFIDMKISKSQRETLPVIACGNEIVWAIGIRLGFNYKISNDTTNIMVFDYKIG